MDRRPGSSAPSHPSKSQNLLRSSVSMFIEDSRITAVANAEPPPLPSAVTRRPSYFSVTSYTSSSSTTTAPGGMGSSSSYLRPTFCQISASLPDQQRIPSAPSTPLRPRACSSSPVRFPGREFIHSIIREDEELISNTPSSLLGRGRRQPPPPPSTVRRRSTLSVEPVMSFLSVKEALPPVREDRAYTSVNLTLRTPSIGGGGGVTAGSSSGSGGGGTVIRTAGGAGSMNVVNTVNVNMGDGGTTFRHVHRHHSSAAGGVDPLEEVDEEGEDNANIPASSQTNLMYSSYSNSRDGFEAQVQIQFGPNGGTFTACRRRNHFGGCVSSGGDDVGHQQERQEHLLHHHHHHHHNISFRQQMSTDLLSAQSERKEKLRTAIQARHFLLAKLQGEIGQLRSQLELKGSYSELEKLKQENQRLRIECNFMSREVDLYQHGNVPLGETNEEFYQGINPGQSLNALFGITNNRRKIGGPGGQAPPRPPPPKFLQSPTTPTQLSSNANTPLSATAKDFADELPVDGEWTCSMCTFQNHRDLDFCEQCLMVRVKQPQHNQQQQQPNQPHLHHHHQFSHPHGPSRGQNIRIRVRRHSRRPHHHPFDGKNERFTNEQEDEGGDGDDVDDNNDEVQQRRRCQRQQQRRVIHSWVL